MSGSLKLSDDAPGPDSAPACFDPSRAEFPTRVVPTAQLLDLFTTTHAAERIESYRQAMAEGELFPPISVIRIGRRFVIADGHKRFRACQALGAGQVTVELWPLRRLARRPVPAIQTQNPPDHNSPGPRGARPQRPQGCAAAVLGYGGTLEADRGFRRRAGAPPQRRRRPSRGRKLGPTGALRGCCSDCMRLRGRC